MRARSRPRRHSQRTTTQRRTTTALLVEISTPTKMVKKAKKSLKKNSLTRSSKHSNRQRRPIKKTWKISRRAQSKAALTPK